MYSEECSVITLQNEWIRYMAHISVCQYDMLNFTMGEKYIFFLKLWIMLLCILFYWLGCILFIVICLEMLFMNDRANCRINTFNSTTTGIGPVYCQPSTSHTHYKNCISLCIFHLFFCMKEYVRI
jgi:hypothetical protein